jgi:hypothetical protein
MHGRRRRRLELIGQPEPVELALDPGPRPVGRAVTYWGVADATAALSRLLEAGATQRGDVRDVGGDIGVATVLEPGGAVLGIIENPHVALPATTPPSSGPGR